MTRLDGRITSGHDEAHESDSGGRVTDHALLEPNWTLSGEGWPPPPGSGNAWRAEECVCITEQAAERFKFLIAEVVPEALSADQPMSSDLISAAWKCGLEADSVDAWLGLRAQAVAALSNELAEAWAKYGGGLSIKTYAAREWLDVDSWNVSMRIVTAGWTMEATQ